MFADRLGLSARTVYLLFGAWGGFSWSLINAAWFLYYVNVAHLGPLQLVLVGTTLEASYFVWEIPTGVLADTFSRRVSVIAGTGIMMAVRTSTLLVALLAAEFFWGAASEGWDRLSDAHLLLDLNFPPLGLTPVVAFGVLSLVCTVLIVVTAQLVRRLMRSVDEHVVSRMLVGLQVARIACQAAFVFAPSSALALVPYLINSMFRASFYPLFNAWLIRRTDASVRATVLSTTSVSSALGQVGGGPISGAIGNVYGIPLGLLSSVAMLLPGTLFFARAVGLRAGTPAPDAVAARATTA